MRSGGRRAPPPRISRSTARPFRDTMNPNLPRHALWRPGMTWDSIGELDPTVRHPMTRGRVGAEGPSRRHGRDGRRPGVPVPDLVRRGLPPRARSRRRVRAGARLQRLDRRLLRAGARPALRRRDGAAPEHGLRRRGAAPRRAHTVLPRRLPAAHVHRGPLLHPSELRPPVGGAGALRARRRRASHARSVEPRMDLARPVLREGQEPAGAAADDGGRRRPVERRRQRAGRDGLLHRRDPARSPARADPVVLARQPPLRRLDPDRLHRDAALSRA